MDLSRYLPQASQNMRWASVKTNNTGKGVRREKVTCLRPTTEDTGAVTDCARGAGLPPKRGPSLSVTSGPTSIDLLSPFPSNPRLPSARLPFARASTWIDSTTTAFSSASSFEWTRRPPQQRRIRTIRPPALAASLTPCPVIPPLFPSLFACLPRLFARPPLPPTSTWPRLSSEPVCRDSFRSCCPVSARGGERHVCMTRGGTPPLTPAHPVDFALRQPTRRPMRTILSRPQRTRTV